jgi:hypothetical protein
MLRLTPVLFFIACGSQHKAVAQPSHEQPDTQHAREDTWSKLSFEERHSVMTFKVLPNMARTWRDFRHTEDPEMTCRTCHGQDAEAVSYHMPNPSLPKIDPAHPPVNATATFMKTKMVPETSELVGAPIGCNTCHPK